MKEKVVTLSRFITCMAEVLYGKIMNERQYNFQDVLLNKTW